MSDVFDLIIIGSGPAGLTAGIYAARARLNTVIFERETLGGQPVNIEFIENYPSYAEGIAGAELGSKMLSHCMNLGVKIEFAEVTGMELGKNITVRTEGGSFSGRAAIIAGGAKPKKLGVPGEAEFAGKGVIYCAVCDGGRFANQKVAVAGGGDSGLTAGLYLTKIASRVTIMEVLPQLNASAILQERARQNPKVEIMTGVRIEAITGSDKVGSLNLADVSSGKKSSLEVDGILVHVGLQPSTGYLKGLLPLDDDGHIVVNESMETKVPGVFAAGDIRVKSPKQVISACGDGANAALAAIRYLRNLGA